MCIRILNLAYLLHMQPCSTVFVDHRNARNMALQRCARCAGDVRDIARKRYEAVLGGKPETLVSASEDNTMYLWHGGKQKNAISPRITGHQRGIIFVSFSPDGRKIASSSFDKSVKIWNGSSGGWVAFEDAEYADSDVTLVRLAHMVCTKHSLD